ncbi:MAG: glucose 1-dehydrogenase [Phycisphaerales bacterium]|nr:glucose 1-dehydrogenase [Phycisphaerales bacterium]
MDGWGQDGWRLEGRVALVTGASRGIGRAIVDELAARGAGHLLLVARGRADLDAAVERVRADGAQATAIVADVATADGREAITAAVTAAGRLDVLVNNAGTNIRKRSLDYSAVEVAHLLDVNLLSAFELTRALHGSLAATRGCVVNVASVAGITSTGTGGVYAMAKAALLHATRYLAVEWGGAGIRVNAVAPWYVRTPLVEPVLADPGYRARVLGCTPLGRLGEPRDVAAAVAFLSLPAAGWITGQCLGVDGGFTGVGFQP